MWEGHREEIKTGSLKYHVEYRDYRERCTLRKVMEKSKFGKCIEEISRVRNSTFMKTSDPVFCNGIPIKIEIICIL